MQQLYASTAGSWGRDDAGQPGENGALSKQGQERGGAEATEGDTESGVHSGGGGAAVHVSAAQGTGKGHSKEGVSARVKCVCEGPTMNILQDSVTHSQV